MKFIKLRYVNSRKKNYIERVFSIATIIIYAFNMLTTAFMEDHIMAQYHIFPHGFVFYSSTFPLIY
jgi:hypothetical protein